MTIYRVFVRFFFFVCFLFQPKFAPLVVTSSWPLSFPGSVRLQISALLRWCHYGSPCSPMVGCDTDAGGGTGLASTLLARLQATAVATRDRGRPWGMTREMWPAVLLSCQLLKVAAPVITVNGCQVLAGPPPGMGPIGQATDKARPCLPPRCGGRGARSETQSTNKCSGLAGTSRDEPDVSSLSVLQWLELPAADKWNVGILIKLEVVDCWLQQ